MKKLKKVLKEYQKLGLFIHQYNWKKIDFPSHSKNWKKFESNNKSIPLIFCMCLLILKKLGMLKSQKSKYSLERENLLLITNGEKWRYVVLISLSALLRGITGGNNNGDFYCLNCFQSYTTEKSMTAPFVIYADLESLLEEMNTCHNNPEKSATKINKHTPFCYSVFTHCSFDTTKNKFDYYRSKNCMKIFCLDLREHATKIINYEKKEMTNKKMK